ncbi:hypothetical protein [Chitinophaga rhizosphaerae]|uniref:hypothetical protein n=1 Tax=Chitinophaga rhizosphaerae TaxID=1864947 RepID=UPI0013E07E09|nr:hypothetical protein [Chitinophaga rhizosphaerae]
MENIKGCLWGIGILAIACIAAFIIDGLWNGLIYSLFKIPWWLYILGIVGFIGFKLKK